MKQKLKETKAITLIALVVTIIVLLILAGVTISSIVGRNSIVEQANEARNKTQKASVIELAQNDILAEKITSPSGDITIEKLKEVLARYFDGVPAEDELQEKLETEGFTLKSKAEYAGQDIEIADIYSGSLADGTKVTAAKVNAKIGQTVTSYTESSGKVTSWRVFYASEDEMFLISTNTIDPKTAFGPDTGPLRKKGTSIDYTGAVDVFNTHYGATYNSLWEATKSTDTNKSSQATAYLCDEENWTEYVGKNAPKGTYAVGGPTLELLISSWKASGQTKGAGEVLEAVLADTIVSIYGYKYDLRNDSPIEESILSGLYNNGSNYWLASPVDQGGINQYDLCFVGTTDESINWSWWGEEIQGVRPLVSIPMTNVQIKNEIVTIGNN